jgi:hypothetical protein
MTVRVNGFLFRARKEQYCRQEPKPNGLFMTCCYHISQFACKVTKKYQNWLCLKKKFVTLSSNYDTNRYFLLVWSGGHALSRNLLVVFGCQGIPSLWYAERAPRLHLARPQDAGDVLPLQHHAFAVRHSPPK